jgi:DNA polymerase III delta prime subunit
MQNLIIKYQPIMLEDFKLDDCLRLLIKTLMEIDNLNLLFCGSMASGKTSILNSIIREYYTGYQQNKYSDNILYINNLKEQGINYYRSEVKTFCQTCSVIPGKKKFIVLDDIDFINEQNQQVFRNCIDKYKHKVHFMSSCSNIQKVIDSIQSRFTMIKLQSMKIEHIKDIILKIKTNENITIDPDAEEFMINISNSSVNVMINYMEKFKLINKHVDINLVRQLCSNIDFGIFEKYTSYILSSELILACDLIYDIYDKGYSVIDILDNYFLFIKITKIISDDIKYKIIPYICKYITIFYDLHEDEIELALFTNNLVNELTK